MLKYLLGFVTLVSAQAADLSFLNHNRPVVDAHNCYPYDGKFSDRIDRALKAGFPVSIEQDLAWYVDPSSGKGRVVLDHAAAATATDPTLREYFFEHIRPIIEKQLAVGESARWPVVILHFDFKDQQTPLLRAVWALLGQYESWITTAPKGAEPHQLARLDRKPILVLTEDSDAQEEVFFKEVPVGSRLRLFGSAHTHVPEDQSAQDQSREQRVRAAATLSPEQLLIEKPTNYRRWWNNSWYEVEEGGQPKAGAWTAADDKRLRALVDHAHRMGYWIRFYTLDGFEPSKGEENGWFADYNFGAMDAVEERWKASMQAGVDFIATDQYESLSAFMRLLAK